MQNPLLSMKGLPPFQSIQPKLVKPAIEQLLEENRKKIQELLDKTNEYTWENLVVPLEEIEDRLQRVWSPVRHINAVVNTEELREVYRQCRLKLSAYYTEMGQNKALYQAFQSIEKHSSYQKLNAAQKKVIENNVRDFRLSGVALAEKEQKRFKEIQQELSSLHNQFEENILDATNDWTKKVIEKSALAGLPETSIALARQSAEAKGEEGFLLTLHYPSFFAVMTYADDRALREELYHAYYTRASEIGPGNGRWDNTPVLEKIVSLRHELATLLGFANFAERSLATKMAKDPKQVLGFLEDLAKPSIPVAHADFDEISSFAKKHLKLETIKAWDVSYCAEKLRNHKYKISQEELRPYFPVPHVLQGMFSLVETLYNITIEEEKEAEVWHKDAKLFTIYDQKHQKRAQFYLDLFARPNKRGGAWMDDCIGRKQFDDQLQIPVAYLTCNFTPPLGENPALLTHDEVLTLFHEFGHGLHHMLTKVSYPSVAGINGVPWDAVELPSQFMENFCWEKEILDKISRHYQTKDPLPDELFQKMHQAKNFQAGMQMVRQLEFAIFDFRLYLEFDPEKGTRFAQILKEVQNKVAVIEYPPAYRMIQSFSHIFSGGYAAGYYSYKWAEVLSADAYSLFQENGVLDQKTGQKFLSTILEQGGTREPMDLFVKFRGREPQVEALLQSSGIVPAQPL